MTDVFELGLLIDIGMCFSYLITNKYQKKGGSVHSNLKTKVMGLFDCFKHF